MKLAFTAIVLVLSALLLTSCQKQGGLVGDENETYAIVNGKEIKAKDVMERIKNDLGELERQAYELKKRATEEAVNKQIVEDEAKKQGVTIDKLMSQFDALRDKDVSKDDIANFLKIRGVDEKKLSKQDKDSIPQIIKMQRVYEARQRLVGELRSKANVKFKLQKPVEKAVEVGVGSGTPVGPTSAKVKIVEFSDFQCPYCAQARQLLDEVVGKYKDKVAIYFRNFPLESIHPAAFHAAEAGLCAQDQGKFWAMHNIMFEKQQSFSQLPPAEKAKLKKNSALGDEDLKAYAKNIGLDEKVFSECLKSGSKVAPIRKDIEDAMKIGVNSTPTIFINGVAIRGARTQEVFETIEEQLSK